MLFQRLLEIVLQININQLIFMLMKKMENYVIKLQKEWLMKEQLEKEFKRILNMHIKCIHFQSLQKILDI